MAPKIKKNEDKLLNIIAARFTKLIFLKYQTIDSYSSVNPKWDKDQKNE